MISEWVGSEYVILQFPLAELCLILKLLESSGQLLIWAKTAMKWSYSVSSVTEGCPEDKAEYVPNKSNPQPQHPVSQET